MNTYNKKEGLIDSPGPLCFKNNRCGRIKHISIVFKLRGFGFHIPLDIIHHIKCRKIKLIFFKFGGKL